MNGMQDVLLEELFEEHICLKCLAFEVECLEKCTIHICLECECIQEEYCEDIFNKTFDHGPYGWFNLEETNVANMCRKIDCDIHVG